MNSLTKLGEFFTLGELSISEYASRRGIDNTPPPECAENLKLLVENVLDPLREHLGKPLVISSGYRSPLVNTAIGGSATSDHRFGRAADFTQPEMTVKAVASKIIELGLPFDQLIDEYGNWVHVSYRAKGNRGQVLRARRINGKIVYLQGLE